jgi:hypothetical protein
MTTFVFQDGTTLTEPSIIEVGAGWVLRPNEARTDDEIRRGTNKSFGRGWEGMDTAKQWKQDWLQAEFDRRGWPTIASHDTPMNAYITAEGRGLSLSIFDPVWGWNSFSYYVREPNGRYYSNREEFYYIDVTWNGSAVQQWYRDKQVSKKDPWATVELANAQWKFQDRNESIYTYAESFCKDPFAFVQNQTGQMVPWSLSDVPPLDWGGNKEFSKYLDAEQTVKIRVDAEHAFYKNKAAAEHVFVESEEQIQML